MARLALGWCLLASHCAAQSPALQAALATGSYFPLDVGNEWVYRIDARQATALYQTWRVDRTEEAAGATWAVMRIVGPGDTFLEMRFRADPDGRVYQLKADGPELFLDPLTQTGAAELQYTGRGGGYTSALGSFADTYQYRNQSQSMVLETGVLARGVGLLSSTQSLIAGSSGGFSQGRTLVEATLAGGLRIGGKSVAFELGMESLTLDVTGRKVTNCAIPCYFVACAIAPGYDPPDTYKPCAQARVRGGGWSGDAPAVRLELIAPDGAVAWRTTLGSEAARNGVSYVQVPLYGSPNQPFAPGAYRLQATAGDAALASLAVEIR